MTVDDKKKNYRFSISVNSEIYLQDQFDGYDEVIYRSSGMILESCTLQSNNCMEIDYQLIYINNIGYIF